MENFILQVNQKLRAPFPQKESKRNKIRNILAVGLFISLFLYYFFGEAFELQGYNSWLLSVQFGGITVIAALIYDAFVEKVLKLNMREDSWTFLHWMIYMTCLLLLLAQLNYGLFLLHTQFEFELASFWEITQHTIAVGILPVIFSGYVAQIKAAKPQPALMPSPEINSAHQVVLHSKNQHQGIRLYVDDILFIEALENYVFVYFKEGGKVQKELLRNTLKSMTVQLADTSMMRCHRSFIVNTSQIEKVKGNSQGLKLSLNGLIAREIPVSRKYIPSIKANSEACHSSQNLDPNQRLRF